MNFVIFLGSWSDKIPGFPEKVRCGGYLGSSELCEKELLNTRFMARSSYTNYKLK